jgi:phytoene synthase
MTAAANKYCENKVAASGSSFYYSFLFLPPEQRAAITAIYAFCREVDDIVDECSNPEIATQKIVWWAAEIDRVFNGNPQHPVGIALQEPIKVYNLQRIWFDEILQGMNMDLRYQGYQSMDDLHLYCHCVASTVGMLAASIFGYKNAQTMEYAKHLGHALQLVNIIRDIGEDARRGRIYIPEEKIAEFDLTPQEILQLDIKSPNKMTALLKHFAQLARDHYNSALKALPHEDRSTQRSGLIMAKIYFSILDEIERSNFAVLQQKISLTPLRKLWIAWRTWRTEKKLCLAQS